MTLLFFGSDPWFSPPVLEALVNAGHKVLMVVTKGEALEQGKRNKEKGIRKTRIIQANTPQDITLEKLSSCFLLPSSFILLPSAHRPDAIVVAAFGPPFLPDDLLDWPTHGCLNVHASLLPRWRGASPVYAAIAAGDDETGVTIMKMTKEIDRGPILGQAKMSIHQPVFERSDLGVRQGRTFSDFDTRESLTRRLGLLGGELIVKTIGQISHIRPIGQPIHSPTPYTYRLKKEDGKIDWTLHPEETRPERSRRIERFIRAVTPWPGARSAAEWHDARGAWNTTEIKILKAHLEWLHASRLRPELRPRGFTLHASLVPDEVQLPGKNPITWKQFLAGHPGAEFC